MAVHCQTTVTRSFERPLHLFPYHFPDDATVSSKGGSPGQTVRFETTMAGSRGADFAPVGTMGHSGLSAHQLLRIGIRPVGIRPVLEELSHACR